MMSRVELERFVADVKADPRLQAELKERGSGLASVVEIARSRGYEITTDDVRDYVRAPTRGIYAIFEDFCSLPESSEQHGRGSRRQAGRKAMPEASAIF
jgi:predicted ribosomally synthesized peptide with nif11-like leader